MTRIEYAAMELDAMAAKLRDDAHYRPELKAGLRAAALSCKWRASLLRTKSEPDAERRASSLRRPDPIKRPLPTWDVEVVTPWGATAAQQPATEPGPVVEAAEEAGEETSCGAAKNASAGHDTNVLGVRRVPRRDPNLCMGPKKETTNASSPQPSSQPTRNPAPGPVAGAARERHERPADREAGQVAGDEADDIARLALCYGFACGVADDSTDPHRHLSECSRRIRDYAATELERMASAFDGRTVGASEVELLAEISRMIGRLRMRSAELRRKR